MFICGLELNNAASLDEEIKWQRYEREQEKNRKPFILMVWF